MLILWLITLVIGVVFFILWHRGRHKDRPTVDPTPELGRQREALIAQHQSTVESLQSQIADCVPTQEYRQALDQVDALQTQLSESRLALQGRDSAHQQAMLEYKKNLEIEWQRTKRDDRAQSNARSRSALVGKIAENLAPYLPDFSYNPKEARHLGELFDFLIFDGLEDGSIKNVVFLEVKTGNSYQARQLNPREKLLREAIDAGRVKYEVYVPNLKEV